MVQLKNARVTPSGVVPGRGLRLMDSPFAESGTAMQNVQPWVGNPSALSDDQIEVNAHLITAANNAEGTEGTVINPETGRPMPRIAKKVKEYFEDRGWTVSEEEQEAAAKERAKERKREQRGPEYQAYKSRMSDMGLTEAAGNLIL